MLNKMTIGKALTDRKFHIRNRVVDNLDLIFFQKLHLINIEPDRMSGHQFIT